MTGNTRIPKMPHVPIPPPDSPIWLDGNTLLAWMLLTYPPNQDTVDHLHTANWIAQDEVGSWYVYDQEPTMRNDGPYSNKDGSWGNLTAVWWPMGYMPCHLDWKDTLFKLNKEN